MAQHFATGLFVSTDSSLTIKRELSGTLHKNYSLLLLLEKSKENSCEVILVPKKRGEPDFMQGKKFIQEYLDKQVKENNLDSINRVKAVKLKKSSTQMVQMLSINEDSARHLDKMTSRAAVSILANTGVAVNTIIDTAVTTTIAAKDGQVSKSGRSSSNLIGPPEVSSKKVDLDVNSAEKSSAVRSGETTGAAPHKWRYPLMGWKQVTKDNAQNESSKQNQIQSGKDTGSKLPTPLVIDMKCSKVNAKENISSKDDDECVIIIDEVQKQNEISVCGTKRKRDESAHWSMNKKCADDLTNDSVIIIDDAPEDFRSKKKLRSSLNDSVVIVEDKHNICTGKQHDRKCSVLGYYGKKSKKPEKCEPLLSEGKKLKDYEPVLNKDFISLGKCASMVTYVNERAPLMGKFQGFKNNTSQAGMLPVFHDRGKNSYSNEASQSTSSENITSQQQPASVGDNICNVKKNQKKQTGLRPIVIDGSNVAMGHTNGRIFSCEGLKICIDYFLERKHKVIAFVPRFRQGRCTNADLLSVLEKRGLVTFTPSRRVNGKLLVSYDDRFIVQYAAECGGVIVSTDNFRDLLNENLSWKETIERRLLMFAWADDMLMFPSDPLGRGGPTLEEFLHFPE